MKLNLDFFHAGLLDERTTEDHCMCGGEAPATAGSPPLSTHTGCPLSMYASIISDLLNICILLGIERK